MDSHKGSPLLSGHHGSALPLSWTLNASNSVICPHYFLKRTAFFHTLRRTIEDNRLETNQNNYHIGRPKNRGLNPGRGGISVCSPGDQTRCGAHRTSYTVGIERYSFPSLKRPSGGLHPLPRLRMCGSTPPLPNILYYTVVILVQDIQFVFNVH